MIYSISILNNIDPIRPIQISALNRVCNMSASTVRIPSFSELPLRKGDPPHSAWGLYGEDDQLGTLNRLTDETVLRSARDEIRSGFRSASIHPCSQL